MRKVEAVSDHVSQWGEGPVWWDDHFWWVDIEGKALCRIHPETQNLKIWKMDQRIGFALPTIKGTWIWGGDHGLYELELSTGESTPLVNPEPNLPHNRFNDAGVSPDGQLFAGTIALDKTEGAATLYRLDPDFGCTPVIPNVTNSNGIGWSPDGGILFYIDTPTREITRYTYENGEISGRQTLVNTDPIIDASPDGCCVDADGHLWVAFCHGGCVIRFDHETGKELERIKLSEKETTSCCFGGPDLRDLYITTGVGSGDKQSDGRLYVVKGMAITGLPQKCVAQT